MSDEFDFSHLNTKSSNNEEELDFSHLNSNQKSVKNSKKNNISEETKPPSLTDMAMDILSGRVLSGKQGKFVPPYGAGQAIIRAVPKLAESAVESGSNALKMIMDKGNSALESTAQHPVKASRTAIAGIGDMLQNILNIPRNFPKTLSNLELISPEMGNKLTSDRQFNFKPLTNKIAGQSYPGSDLIRKGFENIPIVFPVGKALTESAIGIGKTAAKLPVKIKGTTNPLLEAQKLSKQLSIENAEKGIESAQERYEPQKKAYKEAVIQAKNQGVPTDHEKLVHQLNVHDEMIKEANLKSKELQENLDKLKQEAPKEPEKLQEREIVAPEKKELIAPEKPHEHEERSRKADEEHEIAEENLSQVKENHDQVKKLSKEATDRIGEHLNVGSAHHIHVGDYIKKQVEDIHVKLKKDYGRKVKEVKNDNITINKENIYTPKNPKNMYVKRVLKEMPKKRELKAHTLMTRFKDLKTEIYNLGQEAKEIESARSREKIHEALPELRKLQDSFKKSLDEGLGKHAADFDDLNLRYVDLYDLKESKSVKKAFKDVKLGKSMIDELSGSGVGQELLRVLISKNPEMVKHVVGQIFESKPNLIHKPNELSRFWTKQLPELKKLAEQKIKSDEMVKQSEKQIEEAQKQRDITNKKSTRANNEAIQARKEHSEKVKEHKEQVREQTAKEKSYQKEIEDYESEKDRKNEEIETHGKLSQKHNDQINKLEKSIEKNINTIEKIKNDKQKIKEHMQILREKFNAANITLEEKSKLGFELKKLKKEYEKLDDSSEKSTTGLMLQIKRAKTFYKYAKKVARGF